MILVEGRDEKVGQKYTDPLLMLTGEEYARLSFQELLDRMEQAMPWDPDVAGLSIGADGQRKVIRVPGWMELESQQRSSVRIEAILAQARIENKVRE